MSVLAWFSKGLMCQHEVTHIRAAAASSSIGITVLPFASAHLNSWQRWTRNAPHCLSYLILWRISSNVNNSLKTFWDYWWPLCWFVRMMWHLVELSLMKNTIFADFASVGVKTHKIGRPANALAQWYTSLCHQLRTCIRNPDVNPGGIMCFLDDMVLGVQALHEQPL